MSCSDGFHVMIVNVANGFEPYSLDEAIGNLERRVSTLESKLAAETKRADEAERERDAAVKLLAETNACSLQGFKPLEDGSKCLAMGAITESEFDELCQSCWHSYLISRATTTAAREAEGGSEG